MKNKTILSFAILSASQSISSSKTAIPLCVFDKTRLIDLQVEEIKKLNDSIDIIFGIGFDYKRVIDYIQKRKLNIRTIENCNYKSTSSIETLRLILNSMLPCDLFIVHGDRQFRFLDKSKITEPTIFIDKQLKNRSSIGVSYQNGMVNNLSYGLDNTWSEVLFLPEYIFDEAKTIANKMRANSNIADFINKLNDKKQFKVDNRIEIKTL